MSEFIHTNTVHDKGQLKSCFRPSNGQVLFGDCGEVKQGKRGICRFFVHYRFPDTNLSANFSQKMTILAIFVKVMDTYFMEH
jgi:hypothetical protein